MTHSPDRFIAYPERAVMSVIDDSSAVEAATGELLAAGIDAGAITVLQGPAGADRIDGMGRANGLTARIRRLLAFTVMDQLPDFVLYERALRDGRSVMIVRAPTENEKHEVHAIMRRHGGHFTNYYGRFATEELDLWRGAEPDIPDILRR